MTFDERNCEGFGWLPPAGRTLQIGWVKSCTFADVVVTSRGINYFCDLSIPLSFSLISLPLYNSMGVNIKLKSNIILLD